MVGKIFDQLILEIQDNKYEFLNFSKIDIPFIDEFNKKLQDKFDNIVIVGFGASSLNSKAILSSIRKSEKKVIYLDSLDSLDIEEKLSSIKVDRSIFFILSKSGNSHETYILAKYLIEILKINLKNIYLISANSNNLLFNLSKNYNINYIEHDAKSSGRYSIISLSSILPAAFAGVEHNRLIEAAINSLNKFLSERQLIEKASYYLDNYSSGKNIFVTFNYSQQLTGLCQWQQQMIGESLGKNNFGISPFLARGSFDEHSQLQLYLDGPDDKFYKIMADISSNDLLSSEHLKHVDVVYNALLDKQRSVIIENYQAINEEIIADKVVETMILIMIIARFKNINPFDQPAVDACKIMREVNK